MTFVSREELPICRYDEYSFPNEQEVWEGARGSDEYTFSSTYLDNTIEWAVVELEKWQCKRTAYDTWQFNSIQDAEKFKTLFFLKQP